MREELFVSMKHVSKTYTGVKALDKVDFTLKKGEIHCLIGENGSGKSTLIKILCGAEVPDAGTEIEVEQLKVRRMTRGLALSRGINVIYQDLSLFPNLTVAENICFNFHVDGRHKLVSKKKMREIAGEKIRQIGQKLDPDALVGSLSIADKQLVAICRALVGELKLLIMDEPTSSLTAKEVGIMFGIIHKLVEQGTTILFVSHKLDEVVEIADRVTVFKDGKNVGMLTGKEMTKPNIIYLMSNKKLELKKLDQPVKSETRLLEVEHLSRRGEFEDISFCVREGEVVGIIGLLGAGRTELAKALIGYAPADEGVIRVEGREVALRTIRDGMKNGIGMVSEDRLNEGLIMRQSVENNLAVTTLHEQLNRLRLLDAGKKNRLVADLIRRLFIKVPSVDSSVNTLSGGNQQKVVVGKWLAVNPRILILDGPTIGIDIAARSSIYDIIKGLAREGMAVIVISDEVEEVLENAHRIFVMRKGRFVKEFEAKTAETADIQASIEEQEETAV